MKIVFFLLFVLLTINLHAVVKTYKNPALTSEQTIIIQTILSHDGYIDEQLYNSFWNGFKNPKIKKEIIDKKNLKQMLIISQKLQYEFFTSIKKSIEQGDIVKSNKINSLLPEAKKVGIDMTIPLKNFDAMLNAAVKKEPINKNGQLVYITIDLADQVISKLDGSIERASMLFSEKWIETPKERKVGALKLIWSYPFSMEKKEKNIKANIITSAVFTSIINKYDYLIITEIESSMTNTDRCIQNILGETLNVSLEHRLLQTKKATLTTIDNSDEKIQLMCVHADKYMYIIEASSNQLAHSLSYMHSFQTSVTLP